VQVLNATAIASYVGRDPQGETSNGSS